MGARRPNRVENRTSIWKMRKPKEKGFKGMDKEGKRKAVSMGRRRQKNGVIRAEGKEQKYVWELRKE